MRSIRIVEGLFDVVQVTKIREFCWIVVTTSSVLSHTLHQQERKGVLSDALCFITDQRQMCGGLLLCREESPGPGGRRELEARF